MAEFTMLLRDVLEQTNGYMGLDEYPIFDETHREVLNKKIKDHYLMQEIGQETIELHCHFMRRRMQEIMPYFNQLYATERLKFDPFITMRMESTSESESQTQGTGTAENTNTQKNKSRAVNSDTPQAQLMADGDYATGLADVISDATADGIATNTDTNQGEGKSHSVSEGYQGSPADLLNAFRATILNIDMMIIDALSDLYMLIWSTDGNNF